MSSLCFLLLLVFLIGKTLACREQFSNQTRINDNPRYDYTRRRYVYFDSSVVNSTIVCANIYSVNQIFYTYHEQSYEQFLKIVDSNITTLEPNEFSQFSTITKLFLSGVHLKNIMPAAFTGLARLEELYLDNNELTQVPKGVFNSLQKLQILDLSGNRINQVEKFALVGVSSLEKLFLQSNRLTVLDNNTLGKLTHLKYLDVSRNPLESISLGNLTSLQTLMSTDTRLTTFGDVSMENLTLKLVNLSNSRITEVDLALFPEVETLDLTNNSIASVKNCQKLKATAVSFSNNRIKAICGGFNSVSQLILSHNELTSVDRTLFNDSKNLYLLDLSFNKLSTLDNDVFKNLTALQGLWLNNNNISALDPDIFKNLENLLVLNLSSNVIDDFQYGTFSDLKDLYAIDVSHNRLSELHPYLFYSLSNLVKLYFGANNISSFDVKDLTSHLSSIKLIALDGNPWKCRQLVAMSHALKNMSVVISEGDSYDVENFQGIACQDDKETDFDTKGVVQDMVKQFREAMKNETSQMDRFFDKDFMNSNFVKFFQENFNGSQKEEPVAAKIQTIERGSDGNGVLVFSVILQIVMCCLLIFIVYMMFSFLKDSKSHRGIDRLSQVELC